MTTKPDVAQQGPSVTALITAAARAAHLIVDGPPPIFADTLAVTLLGDRANELLGYHRAQGDHPILRSARSQTTARSRYTEDRVEQAVESGIRQYVILGAGLDSFAYRSRLIDRVRVFEVDRPATQEWKRRRLADSGVPIPDAAMFVPVDFERDSLADRLRAGGFDESEPAIVSWLGVTVYLSRPAIAETLAMVAGFAPGTSIIVDYAVPVEMRNATERAHAEAIGEASAGFGEAWRSLLTPDEAGAMLSEHGIDVIEDVGHREMIDAELWNRADGLLPSSAPRMVRGRVPGRRVRT